MRTFDELGEKWFLIRKVGIFHSGSSPPPLPTVQDSGPATPLVASVSVSVFPLGQVGFRKNNYEGLIVRRRCVVNANVDEVAQQYTVTIHIHVLYLHSSSHLR